METRPRAVVLVNGFSSGLAIKDEAKKRGYVFIGYQTEPLEFWNAIPNAYRPGYIDEGEKSTFFDHSIFEQNLEKGIEKLKALDVDIRGFIAGAEAGVRGADYLAHAFGVRCNAPEKMKARRDKAAMNEGSSEPGWFASG